jgi:hypothetical protein
MPWKCLDEVGYLSEMKAYVISMHPVRMPAVRCSDRPQLRTRRCFDDLLKEFEKNDMRAPGRERVFSVDDSFLDRSSDRQMAYEFE